MKFDNCLTVIGLFCLNCCTPNHFANNIKDDEGYFVIQYKAKVDGNIHTLRGRSLNDSTVVGQYRGTNHNLFENANIGDTLYKKRGEYEFEIRNKDYVCIFPYISGTAVYRNGGVHHLELDEPHFTCTSRK